MGAVDKQVRKRVYEALGDAFPTRDDLTMFLDFALDQKLDNIAAATDSYDKARYRLVVYAAARGFLEDLVRKAAAQVPGNAKLRAIVETIGDTQTIATGGNAPAVEAGGARGGAVPAGDKAAVHAAGDDSGNALDEVPVGMRRLTAFGRQTPGTARMFAWPLFLFGVLATVGVLALMLLAPRLDERQYQVVRVVLAIGVAALATLIPGKLNIDTKWLRAGGPLAVFVATLLLAPDPTSAARLVTVTGTILFEGTTRPVTGVVVSDPRNNLKSSPTGPDGHFTLSGVERTAGDLQLHALHAGQMYHFTVTTVTGQQYAVIARPPPEPKNTNPVRVDTVRTFRPRPAACPAGSGYQGWIGMVDVPEPPRRKHETRLRVQVPPRTRIRLVVFDGVQYTTVTGGDRTVLREIAFAAPAEVMVGLCTSGPARITAANLDVRYWFQIFDES